MGVTDYTRFICGYHMRTGRAAVKYDWDGDKYCALDWYAQSSEQRLADPDVPD